ncbi:hypothetical protein A2154_02525 [Candidatus Gottesmanbacteria bacterium RBG_16_43_7]|uniref:Uncharacterized protein n=1 Tax=Candidatus Gottesmanbacteria bacterium RBG_16_43_7 TaxID=1798373 RepID=A0A1F5ZBW3_9BACT|nr:MAG: hypothetical protein A2154_02525 [Candidatus Gottesmanbacteria bacterium RBG_16_43_7]
MTVCIYQRILNCPQDQGAFVAQEGQNKGSLVTPPFCPDCPDANNTDGQPKAGFLTLTSEGLFCSKIPPVRQERA